MIAISTRGGECNGFLFESMTRWCDWIGVYICFVAFVLFFLFRLHGQYLHYIPILLVIISIHVLVLYRFIEANKSLGFAWLSENYDV